ncbi:MAG: hypothetical protein J2P41_13245 [Blastocatellia bacterium]|nr:hypothetical protein [Blastocatellia bacterium]
MFYKTILFLLLPLIIFQLGAVTTGDQPQPYEDADAYEVYAAILPSNWTGSASKAIKLVIQSKASAFKMCVKPKGESIEILKDAISDYVELSKKSWLLQRRFSIEKPYELITSEELKSIFEHGSWEKFYVRYPNSGGVIDLSPVGFNKEKTVAIVYMGHSCGGLCGAGTFYVLQKKDGKWGPLKYNGSSCSWVS